MASSTASLKALKKQISIAVSKATTNSTKPPKEKYIHRLIIHTYSKDAIVTEEMIRALCKRLDKDSWVVVLKALIVFHRCFRDGDPHFIESLRTRSNHIFALRRFTQVAPQGNVYTLFVRKYAKYLEEKVSVLRLIGFQFEQNRDACKNLSDKDSFKRVPKLQSQLNALLNCKMKAQHIGKNMVIISTYLLLLKDSLVLYPILNDGVISLIDRVFKMKKSEAKRVLEIYSLFVRETDVLISLYDISRSFTSALPQIHRAKQSLIETLQAHIDQMPDDDSEASQPEVDVHEEDPVPQGTAAASTYPGDAVTDEEDEDEVADSSDDEEDITDEVPVREPLPAHLLSSSSSAVPAVNAANQPIQLVQSPSLAQLSSAMTQQKSTMSGWAIFDDTPPQATPTPINTGSASPSISGARLTFGTTLDTIGFDSWANDFSATIPWQNTTSTSAATPAINPFAQPSSPPPQAVSYQQKADSIKNMLGQFYQQNPTPVQPVNPFVDQAALQSLPQSVPTPNPFLSQPAQPQSPVQQLQQQQQGSFNPFL